MDIPVGKGGEQITVFWSDPIADQRKEATSVFIVIHGKLRDGNNYWGIMNDALESALKDEVPNVDEKAFVIAPQFFSEEYNSGVRTTALLLLVHSNSCVAAIQQKRASFRGHEWMASRRHRNTPQRHIPHLRRRTGCHRTIFRRQRHLP